MTLAAQMSAVLDRIPLTARHVVQVGGGRALAEAYLRRNPAARMEIVAPDQLGTIAPGSADCLIYAENFQRADDPAARLRHDCARLAPAGVVLLALPNAEHWRLLDRGLRGGWDYENPGAGHPVALPGLPHAAVRRIIMAAGLHIIDATPVDPDPEGAAAFLHALGPGLQRLGVDAEDLLARAAPRAWVWRARRQQRDPITVVSNMLPPVGGVTHVRVIEPMRALLSDPDIVPSVIGYAEAVPQAVPAPKIFILHRPILVGEHGLNWLRRLVEDDWQVVSEFDDNPDFHPALRQPGMVTFSGADAVQTSTARLADLLRPQNPEIAVFENAIAELPDIRNYADPDVFTLLCAGLNREDDTRQFAGVLNAVAAKAGPRLRFRIVGDAALFATLDTPHKQYFNICAYDTYRDLLATSEISFMPLRDTAFNRCKSDLKFIEAAAHRVTALASDVVYRDSIEDRHTGMLFANAEELEHTLTRLLDRPGLGRALADNARDYVVRHRMAAGQMAARAAWYRSLAMRKDSLRAALLGRIPDLQIPRGAVSPSSA